MFDRYSTRFGSRSEQPNLNAERATNYEIGWSDKLMGSLRLSSAVFYSDIEDSIQTSFSGANQNGSLVVYNADGENHGFELSADWDASRTLRLGGNYTYLERDLHFRGATFPPAADGQAEPTQQQRNAVFASQVEGTPRHEIFLYAAWRPFARLTLTPSLEIASDRTALITGCTSTLVRASNAANNTPSNTSIDVNTGKCGKRTADFPDSPTSATDLRAKPNYIDIGAYALLNFQAEYAFTDDFTVAVGGTNLLDQNYNLADGFPEPGRQFYVTARAKF